MAYGQKPPHSITLGRAAIAPTVKSGRYPDFPGMAARQTSGVKDTLGRGPTRLPIPLHSRRVRGGVVAQYGERDAPPLGQLMAAGHGPGAHLARMLPVLGGPEAAVSHARQRHLA